jgi:competence protein ComEC
LRATAMAGIAAVAAGLGREASSRRILALAVAGLVLLDPPLVRSVAFQLSVLASGGILFLSAPIARRIPGPRWLATALAVTVAAQAATAPLLAATFGGVPVASVPANLAAGPASGPIMIWGLTAGPLAGVLGGPMAALIHLPTRVLLAWVEAVAAGAAAAQLGELGLTHVVVLGAVVGAGAIVKSRATRVVLTALGLVVCLHPALVLARSPPLFTAIDPDTALWRGGGAAVLVVGPDSTEATLVRELRRAGTRRVDIAVFTEPDRHAPEQLRAIRERVSVGVVFGPAGASPRGFRVPADGTRLTVGALTVVLTTGGGGLDPQISLAAG